MPWNESEMQALVTAHLRGHATRCPICKGPVDFEEAGALGTRIPDYLLNCRKCGENAQYSGGHLEAMDLEWTQRQMRAIVDEYWDRGHARCPNDKAVLEVEEFGMLGQSHADLIVNCKLCGRNFQTPQLEQEVNMSPFDEKYEILRPLNQGGMGKVDLVKDRKTSVQYAAKTIKPEYLRVEEIIKRFQREKRIMSSLDHANIVPIRDSYLDENGRVFVMDYMPGGTLFEKINDRNVSDSELVNMFKEVVAGIDYLHQSAPKK